ncbi:MAG: methyltransferase domain-containing protein [Candidatus Eremiobacteraeota bacterium]|nr:methyltransferase domain-containing protein [Candidatus Eremiobacteraeota bacterium]
MFLLKAPAGTVENGELYGHTVFNGKMIVWKQFWWHFLTMRGWKDITPPWWGRSHAKLGTVRKVLHIYHGTLYDMLFLTPVLRAYANQHPVVMQVVDTSKKGAGLLEANPWISKITVQKNKAGYRFVDEFDDVLKYDGIESVYRGSELNNIYDLMAGWAGIELDDHEKRPEIFLRLNESRSADELLLSWGFRKNEQYIVIEYDTTPKIRTFPPETLFDLAKRLAGEGHKVILFGYTGLGRRGAVKCGRCGRRSFIDLPEGISSAIVKCRCGMPCKGRRAESGFPGLFFIDNEKVGGRTVASIISRAEAFIGPDSWGLHVAAGFDRPSLGVFFSTDGDLSTRYYKKTRCMQIDAPCGPCFQHGVDICRKRNQEGYSLCADKVTADELYGEFIKVMEGDFQKGTTPFKPLASRDCPVCGGTGRRFISRKKWLCYYECLNCTVIYTDGEAEEPLYTLGYFDKYHERINESGQRYVARILHRNFFKAGALALDVGCGTAHTLDELRRQGWGVEGIDPSRAAIEESEKRYPRLAGKLHRQPFEHFEADKEFTLVWMNKVFERFHEPREIFSQVHALLGEAGVFSLQSYDGDVWRKNNLSTHWDGVNTSYAGEHSIIPNERSLKQLAEDCGFEFIGREKQYDPDCLFASFRKCAPNVNFSWKMSLISPLS